MGNYVTIRYPKRIYIEDLEQTKTARYYYHVTEKDFGRHVILYPRENNDPGVLRGGHEPEIARICVAPTISGCLTSIAHLKLKKFKVYRTWRKELPFWPICVFDSAATREKWLLDSTDFILQAEYEIDDLYDQTYYGLSDDRFFENKKAIKYCILEHGLEDRP